MLLNQTIDLIQQMQAAVGHVLDERALWETNSAAPNNEILKKRNTSNHDKRRTEQLHIQRERLECLRRLLGQAAASLLHGIIVQSRTVPSMAAHIGDEDVPLDAEEDRDAHGLDDAKTFVGDV